MAMERVVTTTALAAVVTTALVAMVTTTDVLDISRREADIAIRIDNNPPDTLVGKRLFPYFQTAYANEDYLASHDLENAPQDARLIAWRRFDDRNPPWTKDLGFGDVPLWGYFPDPAMQVAAAKGGLGIAILPCVIGDVEPGLVRASLRRPTKAWDIWLLTHSDLRKTARIKAFMDFVEAVMRDAKKQFQGELS